METQHEYSTPQDAPRRSRTALNMGLSELKTIIPELDQAERAMLVGQLGDALFKLVGERATILVSKDGRLYQMQIEAFKSDLLDTADEKAYNGSVE